MLRYILVSSSFVAYLLLLSVTRKDKFPELLQKSFLWGFCFWGGVIFLVFIVNIITNLVFFGNFFSPLEEQVYLVPILRAPLVEEGSKLFWLYILKKKLGVSGNDLIRLGGSIGNWFSFGENINYILSKNISLWITTFRLFPTHICYTFLDAFGLKNNLSKKRIIFPVLAIFLHGFQNFLSINYFILYVFFGFAVFLSMFLVILIRTPV